VEIRPIVISCSWFINHSGTADMVRVDPVGILLTVIRRIHA
jgi:hypothetical protein